METLSRQGRLRAGLQYDCVACDDGWEDGVDGDEVGEVPGREDEDDAEGSALDGELEPWRRREGERGEGGAGDGEHVFGALEEAAHLAKALRDGPVGCV